MELNYIQMKRLFVYDLCYGWNWNKGRNYLEKICRNAESGGVICIRFEENVESAGDAIQEYLYEYIFEMMNDLFSECPTGNKSRTELVIVYFFSSAKEETEKNNLIEKCNVLYERLHSILGMSLRIGIGGEKEIGLLRESLMEAECALTESVFRVSHYDDVNNGEFRNNQKGLADRAILYMRGNYEKSISLESVARENYVSPNYLSTVLKTETGKSYIVHLIEIRIEEAKRLLKETNLSAKEIGKRVGYPDTTYFSRLFKKQAGMTPFEYRKSRKRQ